MAGTFTLCCYLPDVLGMLGLMSKSARSVSPGHILPSKLTGSPLSAFMIFITTLASLGCLDEINVVLSLQHS